MMQNEINQILEKHKLWLNKKDGGERANLSEANLSKADLRWADLSGTKGLLKVALSFRYF